MKSMMRAIGCCYAALMLILACQAQSAVAAGAVEMQVEHILVQSIARIILFMELLLIFYFSEPSRLSIFNPI